MDNSLVEMIASPDYSISEQSPEDVWGFFEMFGQGRYEGKKDHWQLQKIIGWLEANQGLYEAQCFIFLFNSIGKPEAMKVLLSDLKRQIIKNGFTDDYKVTIPASVAFYNIVEESIVQKSSETFRYKIEEEIGRLTCEGTNTPSLQIMNEIYSDFFSGNPKVAMEDWIKYKG
jgi:hypothetical protein